MSGANHPGNAASYAERVARHVPGLQDMHRMAGILLAEHMPQDGRVLVLGAGGGLESRAFARAYPGWRFDGVDPSPDMLAQARDTLGKDAARVAFHQGYIEDAPEGPFDGATCLLTLHFLPHDERFHTLRALRRRLRPGAPFIMAHHSFPLKGGQHDLWLRRNAAWLLANGTPEAQALSFLFNGVCAQGVICELGIPCFRFDKLHAIRTYNEREVHILQYCGVIAECDNWNIGVKF
jgi:tRNA (cmo5U34)-methyltransferase